MADREGDRSKAPPACKSFDGHPTNCPNLKDITPRSMEQEHYVCDVCGRDFTLYYDEMR